jgi:hypothetical protein
MTQISSMTKIVIHMLEKGQHTMSPNVELTYKYNIFNLFSFTLMFSTNETMCSISFSEHDYQSSVLDNRFHIPKSIGCF